MNTGDFKRKLTAVFSADVAGYSRLMGGDEAATVKTLENYKQVMFSLIKQHRGRVIDSPGDNLLAEFASVVDAVQCGVAVQKELQARNADLPENRRMEFRIGINLGDVIEEGDRIYGDGVNIAARLESCADPGGICISKTAFDQIESKLPLGYQFLGEQTVKNIAKPVGAYKVLMDPRVLPAEDMKKSKPVNFWQRKPILAGVAAVLVVVIGVAVWNFYWRAPKIEPASKDKMAFPLPDKPSIAVLPFVNMSDDKSQEYLADGITENIISALSQVPHLFVIARNSTFTYKGKPVKVQHVAEELGVRYVLEGSVQKSGDTLRITAQLIDAITGQHVWSERYDREMKKIFALQDDITMKVITALQVKLTIGEGARLLAKGTKNLEAYLKFLQARAVFNTQTKEGYAQARRLIEEVIALDPQYAAAYSSLGGFHAMDAIQGFSRSPGESLKQALELVKKAIAIDESEAVSHSLLGWLYVFVGRQYDKAIAECERAIDLAPNSADGQIWMSFVLTMAGRSEEAVRYAEQALRLNPYPPSWWIRQLGLSNFFAGRYEEAIAAYKKSLSVSPKDLLTHLHLTTAYSSAGRHEEAHAQAAEILRINPKFSVEERAKFMPLKNQADLDRYLDGLRKAGLPDKPPLPLPDKPSIAVLPFVNMSDDKNQEFFSDGLTEEIITALSKTPKLFVIARNSSFVYKGKPVNVRQVSRELGVKYVLEGSIRRSGDQLRITAQLIDATTGNHLWAERYDREMKDVFAVQDEITKKIIMNLQVELTEGEQALIYGRGTNNLEAYLKCLQAFEYGRRQNPDDNQKAKRIATEAIALDTDYAVAYRLLAGLHIMDVWLGSSNSTRDSLLRAAELSRKAIALDKSGGAAHALLGHIYILMRDYDKGIEEGQKAVDLEPNGADSHAFLGMGLVFVDNPEEGITMLKKAIRLNPMAPSWYFHTLASAYRNMGRYDAAIEWGKKAVDRQSNNAPAHLILASCYSLAGREEEARVEATKMLGINPKFSLEAFARTTPEKNPEVKNLLIDSLRKAGLK